MPAAPRLCLSEAGLQRRYCVQLWHPISISQVAESADPRTKLLGKQGPANSRDNGHCETQPCVQELYRIDGIQSRLRRRDDADFCHDRQLFTRASS